MYTVKDAYNKIVDESVGGYEEVFQMLWKVKGPLYFQICSWRVFHNCQLGISFIC